jgi:hypothetical protein
MAVVNSSIAEGYREWLRNFPKEPTDRMAAALAAVDAVEAYERDGTAASLAPLVLAACSPHKLVFETGCNLLVKLATRHPETRCYLLLMARDKNATARFHSVAYLKSELPEELRLEIVTLALGDRSAKVRQKGIERAEEFGFKQFLPRLEEMQRTETDGAVLRSLAFHLPILRDGFLLKPSGDGKGYYLTVRGPTSLGGPFIPESRYSDDYVRQEVARLQAGER